MALQGKGMLIWKVKECEKGDPNAIASLAQAAGLEHVVIKIADGISPYNYDKTTQTDYIPATVVALRAKGIKVLGWHYVYGANPAGEAKIAISQTLKYNMEGYVIDAEGEYKQAGRATAARRFMADLRAALPNLPMYLCSYRYPSYHQELPWKEFLDKCDYNMPQVYWEQAHNPDPQLRKSVREFQALSPARPILATGPAYGNNGWSPTPADLIQFMDTARALNIPAVNFFSWDHSRKYFPALWDTIASYPWPGSVVPPKDMPEQIIAALNSRDPARMANLYKQDAVHITAARTIQGKDAIQAWYTTFLTQTLKSGIYKLTGSSGTGTSRHFTWTATALNGRVLNGNDTIGMVDDKIAYHYSSYTVSA